MDNQLTLGQILESLSPHTQDKSIQYVSVFCWKTDEEIEYKPSTSSLLKPFYDRRVIETWLIINYIDGHGEPILCIEIGD